MTNYDWCMTQAREIVKGLAAKPGISIVDKEIAANLLAQQISAKFESLIHNAPEWVLTRATNQRSQRA